jgi:hypothetical protein
LKFCKEKEGLEDFWKEANLMMYANHIWKCTLSKKYSHQRPQHSFVSKNCRELPPHPNIVQVFGISQDGPQPILVMEYCDGGIISNKTISIWSIYSKLQKCSPLWLLKNLVSNKPNFQKIILFTRTHLKQANSKFCCVWKKKRRDKRQSFSKRTTFLQSAVNRRVQLLIWILCRKFG